MKKYLGQHIRHRQLTPELRTRTIEVFLRSFDPSQSVMLESEIEAMFEGFEIVGTAREHHRALPVRRSGLKAALYTYGFKPAYNLIPDPIARRLAYKYSVTAVRI